MNNKPLISIIIPTYNQAEFLKDALACVINQTYDTWEAIVVNNYSKDNTIEIVDSFSDRRIKLVNFNNNGIIAASRNLAISQAEGEYIAFLDSDDLWLPNKLRRCVSLLESGNDLVCHGELWFDNNNYQRKVFYGPEKKAKYMSLLFNGNCISTSATVVRKKILADVGSFSESIDIVTAEDYELWLRLSRAEIRISFINEILGKYRIHESNNSKAVLKNANAEEKVVEKHFNNIEKQKLKNKILIQRRLALVKYGAARRFHANGEYKNAINSFFYSWLTYPFIFRLYIGLLLSFYKIIHSNNNFR